MLVVQTRSVTRVRSSIVHTERWAPVLSPRTLFSFLSGGRPSQLQRDVRALRVCSSVHVGGRTGRHDTRGCDVRRHDGQERQQRLNLRVTRLRERNRYDDNGYNVIKSPLTWFYTTLVKHHMGLRLAQTILFG